jgi:ABC-type proline/glycine betaine transport system permease subunit
MHKPSSINNVACIMTNGDCCYTICFLTSIIPHIVNMREGFKGLYEEDQHLQGAKCLPTSISKYQVLLSLATTTMKGWCVLVQNVKVKVYELWAITLAQVFWTPLWHDLMLYFCNLKQCAFLSTIMTNHIGIVFGLKRWCGSFSTFI